MSAHDEADEDEFEAKLELKLLTQSAIFFCDDRDDKQLMTRYLLEQALMTVDESETSTKSNH